MKAQVSGLNSTLPMIIVMGKDAPDYFDLEMFYQRLKPGCSIILSGFSNVKGKTFNGKSHISFQICDVHYCSLIQRLSNLRNAIVDLFRPYKKDNSI